ncbi:MAG: methyltransferase domain-containing protein [Capsulimonadaceae bacterium]|nr:methyltransferase domain-containing protein [Capsulimonadaceae bacterium]
MLYYCVRLSLIPLLACPDCREDLTLDDGAVVQLQIVHAGALMCRACKRTFPIVDGILRAMPSQLLAEQEREIKARDEQVEQYEAMWYLNLFGKVEIPMTLRRLAPTPSNRLLEAGCGTGRMTGLLRTQVRDVVSVDFSFESLRVNAAKLALAGADNVDLVQADLCNLPFKDAVFDRVVSCQVIEHIPGEQARAAAVSGLSRVAVPGARVVVSAYQHSIFTTSKQGEHDGGIPFFRFTRREFHSLLSGHLRVDSLTGSLVYIHLAQCSKEAAS